MKHQHRATPEQWQAIKANGHLPTRSTILELLHRIEALEATQHAHADASHVIDPEREKAARELMQAAGFAPRSSVKQAAFAIDQAASAISESFRAASAKVRPSEVAAHPPQPNYPEIPNGSLVERVAEALRRAPRRPDYAARAAIREVAAWLRVENGYGPGWAIRLEQEAER